MRGDVFDGLQKKKEWGEWHHGTTRTRYITFYKRFESTTDFPFGKNTRFDADLVKTINVCGFKCVVCLELRLSKADVFFN